jgi:hypothetical protein
MSDIRKETRTFLLNELQETSKLADECGMSCFECLQEISSILPQGWNTPEIKKMITIFQNLDRMSQRMNEINRALSRLEFIEHNQNVADHIMAEMQLGELVDAYKKNLKLETKKDSKVA